MIFFIMLLLIILLDESYFSGEEECRKDCKSYGAEFVEYESPGYRNEECWCRKNNEPLRVR